MAPGRYARFKRWAKSELWERIFADLVRDKKNFYVLLDSTIVRPHRQAAAGAKKGPTKAWLWGVCEEV